MKKINIRYFFQSIKTDELKTVILTLADIELGAVQKLFQEEGFKMIGRNLGSGVKDTEGVEIFDYDYVVSEDRNGGKPISIVFENGEFLGHYPGVRFSLDPEHERLKIIGNKINVPNWINIERDPGDEIEAAMIPEEKKK